MIGIILLCVICLTIIVVFILKMIPKVYLTNEKGLKKRINNKIKMSADGIDVFIEKIDGSWYKYENISNKTLVKLEQKIEIFGEEFWLHSNKAEIMQKKKRTMVFLQIIAATPILAMATVIFIKDFNLFEGDDLHNAKKKIVDNVNNRIVFVVEAKELTDNIPIIGEPSNVGFDGSGVIITTDGKTYSAAELKNVRVCVASKQNDGKTIIFCGQYDDCYRWNGECIIACYADGKLVYTTTDIYDSGLLKSYKRIAIDGGGEMWNYTERTVEREGVTNGDTWNYQYSDIYVPDVDISAVSEKDILEATNIRNDFRKSTLLSHYHGLNDKTGVNDGSLNAYRVTYSDGKIDNVFRGLFINGRYVSGIMINVQPDGTYIYSTGTFHSADGDEAKNEYVSEVLSWDELKKRIQGQPFADEVLSNL